MKRDAVMAVLELVDTTRQSVEETKRLVDGEALQVGDRNLIDRSIATIAREVDLLSRTLREMLEDSTKSG